MEKGANKGKRIKEEEGWVGFKSYDGNSGPLLVGMRGYKHEKREET